MKNGFYVAEYNVRNKETKENPRCVIGPCVVKNNVDLLVKDGRLYRDKDTAVRYAKKRMGLGYLYGERDVVYEYPSMECVWTENME